MRHVKKRRKMKLSTILENENGIVAFACGVISAISFVVLSLLSYGHQGKSNLGIGIVGFFSMIFAIAGLFIGVKAIREDHTFIFTKIGFILNVLLVIVWTLLFVFGMYN